MKRKRSHDKLKINRIEFRTGVDTIRDTIPTIDKVGRDRSGRANDHARSREEKKEISRVLARFLVSRKGGGVKCNYGGKKVRNMRDKWVASGRRNSGNGFVPLHKDEKADTLEGRGGGGRLSRNLEHTLRTLDTFYGCGTLFLSLSLSLALVRSLALSFEYSSRLFSIPRLAKLANDTIACARP